VCQICALLSLERYTRGLQETCQEELNKILTALGVDVSVENFNPIRRMSVVVSGNQESVFIDGDIQVSWRGNKRRR
jgi:hypothetical protein